MNTVETPPETPSVQAIQAALNDPQRLKEITRNRLQDSEPEERFDKFTRMASSIFGVPVSMISILDSENHLVKSGFGLPNAYLDSRRVPLDQSLCKYVVQSGEPLIISDLPASATFQNHPALELAGFKAYMGYPIEINGQTLGAFCLLDYVPRDWSEAEMAVMRDLAMAVITEIKFVSSALELETKARELEIIKEEFHSLFGFGSEDGDFGPPLIDKAAPTSKEITKRLAHLATHDPLTQCFNRNYLARAYDQAIAEVKEGRCAILLGLDFDNFKQVNDTAGHSAGDQFLIAASQIIRDCMRPDDTLLRIGGDEFLLVLRNLTPVRAQALAERIRKKIGSFVFSAADTSFRITVSIGLGVCRRGVPMQDMLCAVDDACYEAKSKGGDRLVVLTD